ncbi:hypothetical protein PUV47_05755 [Pseudovibrio exalbescens]|uniref:capsular polysaccharide export protein, LipB/KpsS family n=1 Tax=Pseudovibrio exalbescens TaxID=197461 RepID=UPI002365D8D9|nr:hypothetical protein [Pseudovibrio exalbescens]MDD7909413.1 hypothetical protein [Pseudovibrio exalbescens]
MKFFYLRFIGYLKSLIELRTMRLNIKRLEEKVADGNAGVPFTTGTTDQYFAREYGRSSERLNHQLHAPLSSRRTKLLLTEDFHLNRRNFSSLHKYLEASKAQVTLGIKPDTYAFQLMQANGNYDEHSSALSSYLEIIENKSSAELKALKRHGTPIRELVFEELLCARIHLKHWQSQQVEKDSAVVFDIAWEHDRTTLYNCYAAALFWFDFWQKIPDLDKQHIAVIFSGSRIYCRTLMQILRKTQVRCCVAETFLTGNHFYLEHRYTPISNASNSRHSNHIVADLNSDLDSKAKRIRAIQAHNAFRSMKNKNVTQPPEQALSFTQGYRNVHLILGQVINDYSIISGDGTVLSTIPAYKKMIEALLADEDALVVFKAHPWETAKYGDLGNVTLKYLQDWQECLPAHQKERLVLLENSNLRQLLRECSGVFTLCSQGAIEAALEGFKPFVIGGAFYDQGGFTNNLSSTGELRKIVEDNKLVCTLSLEEYEGLEAYLSFMILDHLFLANNCPLHRILAMLQEPQSLPHIKSKTSEISIRPTFEEALA